MKYKICKKCNAVYPETSKFFQVDKRNNSGLGAWCKQCINKHNRKYNKGNKRYTSKYRRKKHQEYQLKFKYGITQKDYDIMYRRQGGRCKICGRHQSDIKKTLIVDHNHKTKRIRGLLCNNCNTGLGLLRDNPLILIKGIKYLKDE